MMTRMMIPLMKMMILRMKNIESTVALIKKKKKTSKIYVPHTPRFEFMDEVPVVFFNVWDNNTITNITNNNGHFKILDVFFESFLVMSRRFSPGFYHNEYLLRCDQKKI